MKLKVSMDAIKNINNHLLNKIGYKQKNFVIDFFHNKLLNNIIEIKNYDNDFASLSNRFKGKNPRNNNSSLRKVNSAILGIPKTQRSDYSNDVSNKIIKSNKIFNKFLNNSIYLNNDFQKKIKNKSINEENKLLRTTIYNFPKNINSIENKKSKIFSKIIKSQKADKKCNKMNKYANILEKKMKEKLMQITNFEDINCSCKKLKIKNISKNNNNNQVIDRIFLDINKIYKLSKLQNNRNSKIRNNISSSKTNNLQSIVGNNSISNTFSDTKKFKFQNLNRLSQYLKEQVKNFFIKNNFSSIKDFFNDWLLFKTDNEYKNKLYLDIDNIYYYLKHKIGLNIQKENINKIFGNFDSYLDEETFKNYFFEENPGKESLIITKDLLLTKTKGELYNKMDTIFSLSNYYDMNKEKSFSFRLNLLFNALKKNKSTILDRACDSQLRKNNNNNIEYDYKDFFNLINSLEIDKYLLESKNIKKLFIKFQNKNRKLNIKYFINILYGNDNINKECLLSEDRKYQENNNQKINNNSKSNTNKLENIKNNKKSCNLIFRNLKVIEKKEIKSTNNRPINQNKNSEGSSDYMDIAIKPKKTIFKNKFIRNSNISSPHKKILFVKSSSNSSQNISKTKKRLNVKMLCDLNKNIKENKNVNNTSNNSKGDEFNSISKEKKIINVKKSSPKNKRQKNIKYNNYKTIKLHNKYKFSQKKEISKNDDIEKQFKIKRPLSSNLKRRKKVNQFKKENNHSTLKKFETSKILGESRIQYLNSDIIDLI